MVGGLKGFGICKKDSPKTCGSKEPKRKNTVKEKICGFKHENLDGKHLVFMSYLYFIFLYYIVFKILYKF